jgi:glycosyltransferase involved in cell wall biosynthesis
MNSSPVISAIVTFHNEKRVALQTLEGMERLRLYADTHGISVEFVSVLDCADDETSFLVKSSPSLRKDDQVIVVSNRDLGSSRNCGVRASRGRFIGIFDGDDYYSDNWLVEAYMMSCSKVNNVIIHPELQVSFGATHCVAKVLDMDSSPDYPLQNCLVVHPWIACSFGAREIYEDTQYSRSDTKETGFGFEDWQWNLETISKGVHHIIVSETAHYYRRKSSSMLTDMVASNAIIRPTAFFNFPERWNSRYNSQLLKMSSLDEKLSKEVVPKWVISGFRNIAKIEPNLYPNAEFLDNFFLYHHPFNLAPGELYKKSFSCLNNFNPDVICLIPSINFESSENSFFYQYWSNRKVLIISLLDHVNPNEVLPEGFSIVEFGGLSCGYSEKNMIIVLTRLILQSTASEICVINSLLGWEVVKQHCKSFNATGKKIFASAYKLKSSSLADVKYLNQEMNQCLQEYEAGNAVAQAKIANWESLILQCSESEEHILNNIRGEGAGNLVERGALFRRFLIYLKSIFVKYT